MHVNVQLHQGCDTMKHDVVEAGGILTKGMWS